MAGGVKISQLPIFADDLAPNDEWTANDVSEPDPDKITGRRTMASSVFKGDMGSGGKIGFVPAPEAGDAEAGKVLGAGGEFITVGVALGLSDPGEDSLIYWNDATGEFDFVAIGDSFIITSGELNIKRDQLFSRIGVGSEASVPAEKEGLIYVKRDIPTLADPESFFYAVQQYVTFLGTGARPPGSYYEIYGTYNVTKTDPASNTDIDFMQGAQFNAWHTGSGDIANGVLGITMDASVTGGGSTSRVIGFNVAASVGPGDVSGDVVGIQATAFKGDGGNVGGKMVAGQFNASQHDGGGTPVENLTAVEVRFDVGTAQAKTENLHGIRIYDDNPAGAAEHVYGLKIDSIPNSPDQWGIYVAPTCPNYFAGPVSVPDDPYDSGWDGSDQVPTKNTLYDKIQTLEIAANKNQANGYAGLDASSKINPSHLPAIAISNYLGTVASEVAMLALTGERGDWAVRSDLSKTFMLIADDASLIASWQEVVSPTAAVSSVFGRTGAVTAQANDYTWAQVNKTTSSLADLATRSATDLTSGTLPDARFPATLPALSGANLTALNASNLSSGTVADARLSANVPLLGTQTLTDGATINWDVALGPMATVTLGGNRTLANPTNLKAGASYAIKVIQDGTGGRTLAFGSAYKFEGGVDPVLSTAAGAVDIITFISDGTNLYGAIIKGFA